MQMKKQLRVYGFGEKVEAPDQGQQAGRYAEGDGVGKRIQFLAKLAGGVGHAGDAAIQRIEGNGKQDGHSRPVEVGAHIAGRR